MKYKTQINESGFHKISNDSQRQPGFAEVDQCLITVLSQRITAQVVMPWHPGCMHRDRHPLDSRRMRGTDKQLLIMHVTSYFMHRVEVFLAAAGKYFRYYFELEQ